MKNNAIYGSIIGDIVGAPYEHREFGYMRHTPEDLYNLRTKILDKDTPLFTKVSFTSDDTHTTIAIMKALTTDKNYKYWLKYYGLQNVDSRDIFGKPIYAKGYTKWLKGDFPGNSFGNGCIMRVSPIGYVFSTLEETLSEAEKSVLPSHNNEDSIRSARAIAGAVYLLRNGFDKESVKNFVASEVGSIDYNLKDLQKNNRFYVKASITARLAVYCFLQSESFEDCLRKTLSIGGDSDTLAAVSCGLAGAYFGVPQEILNGALEYLDENQKLIIQNFADNLELSKSL